MAKYNFGNLVAGRWTNGDGETFSTVNPARPGETIGEYCEADAATIAEACRAAADAQAAWRSKPATERAAVVEGFLAAVGEKSADIALAITLEQGKPLAESRGETAKSLAEARTMMAHVLRAGGEVAASARPGFRNLVTRRPRGVIAAITPWNFPILTPMRKIAPALLFGNAIVLKPSEFAPATACLVAEASRGILPEGLFQIVQGAAKVGDQLVRQPQVAGITFTGSVKTGRAIYASGAETLAELSLELGGKNAAIVNDVADLDFCLDQIAAAAFQCAGQRCTAISRVIVSSKLEKSVTDGLVERARRFVLGDGAADGTTMGPLTNASQIARVERMVETGTGEGARAVTGGGRARLQGLEEGYFYTPTILSHVTPEMSVAREEIFGPVISVLTYDGIDEALGILNGADYGLTSALFSNDLGVVQRFIDESQNGMLHVNHGTIPDNHMPFGGIRNSGVGAYSVGPSAAQFYTTEHSVYLKPA
ncbi:MAG TPA: aldehyde dehydrogenase family protein [Pararhizobium sp.]|nr:aldehyde dehydrogenase family protein [Pararhizobium sp.]